MIRCFDENDTLFFENVRKIKKKEEVADEPSVKNPIITFSRAYAYARAVRSFCLFAVTSVTAFFANRYFSIYYAIY